MFKYVADKIDSGPFSNSGHRSHRISQGHRLTGRFWWSRVGVYPVLWWECLYRNKFNIDHIFLKSRKNQVDQRDKSGLIKDLDDESGTKNVSISFASLSPLIKLQFSCKVLYGDNYLYHTIIWGFLSIQNIQSRVGYKSSED